ncbi:cleft lip and palate transmembrane protein 1-like protein [Belonocnema kinseyi]|uniref:cleft lip and palate transmembrane protein 1-like protein n=1 Tax=Belonocnema kinseyi TaxID=2817044 RepID=UPI00143DB40A|nr:cleft lip and palate transmembrane protein 1-like protein [Belonocnema kinseyi]
MKWPSFSLIISGVFLAYICHSIYNISLLFIPPPCEKGQICLSSYLSTKPELQLDFFSSVMSRPLQAETTHLFSSSKFNYEEAQDFPLTLDLPRKTRHNGTLYLHVFLSPVSGTQKRSFYELQRNNYAVSVPIKMTQFAIPELKGSNLLGVEQPKGTKSRYFMQPLSHLKSTVTFTIMTDLIDLPTTRLPMELLPSIKQTRDRKYLPIINYNFLHTRLSHLVPITTDLESSNVTVSYSPISVGKLRLVLHVQAAMQGMKGFSFSDKDVDEVKGILADTNLYLLAGTVFIAAMHLLFDFLAFKNDVSFWRSKNNLAGLSIQTVVWRAFSQTIIFFYLLDEGSSLLILIPAGIGTIIELWKSKKILRVEIVRGHGFLPRIKFNWNQCNSMEAKSREFDAESMRYLSYLLYPLVFAGAVYSLLYQAHKSWYSWCINSLVNGVYAFGFLFMLPQLFLNYKLKSVAHLPWRAFMYKAFNTFIDDVFAFIITMPMAHRVACFRDDAVFLVYLYQRWLYPVDKSRLDSLTIDENPVGVSESTKKIQ